MILLPLGIKLSESTDVFSQIFPDQKERVKLSKQRAREYHAMMLPYSKALGLHQMFQVRGVPTFVIFKNGKQVWRQSGMLTKNDLKQKIVNA